MGMPAPYYPLPPYRQPSRNAIGLQEAPPTTTAKRRTKYTYKQPPAQASAFSVRHRRWSKTAAVHWILHWPASAPRTGVQEAPHIIEEYQPTMQDTMQQVEQGANAELQEIEQNTEQDVNDEFNDFEFSVPWSPMPKTPPSSATSELSASSLDSDYKDFCSRREAFLAQCWRLIA